MDNLKNRTIHEYSSVKKGIIRGMKEFGCSPVLGIVQMEDLHGIYSFLLLSWVPLKLLWARRIQSPGATWARADCSLCRSSSRTSPSWTSSAGPSMATVHLSHRICTALFIILVGKKDNFLWDPSLLYAFFMYFSRLENDLLTKKRQSNLNIRST